MAQALAIFDKSSVTNVRGQAKFSSRLVIWNIGCLQWAADLELSFLLFNCCLLALLCFSLLR